MDALLKRLDVASCKGDIEEVKVLLNNKPLVDKLLNEVRDNPLHIAAFFGHGNFAREVVKLYPEFAMKHNIDGRTPLHLAAIRGHLHVAEMLVNQVGSDICRVHDSKDGYLPVHYAAIHGNFVVVVMLIRRCEDTLHELTSRNETLLHLAVKANCLKTIKFFICHGMKLDLQDDKGNTCLHVAVARRNQHVIRLLLKHVGAEINSINKAGQTPLDFLDLWNDTDDGFWVNMLSSAGGKRASELKDLKSIPTDYSSPVTSSTSETQSMISNADNIRTEEKHHDESTLLVGATLLVTINFQAILNPPGGYIPSGAPVLLRKLRNFYVLDSLALFASLVVILLLLCGASNKKIFIKFLRWVIWFAVFCTGLAFASAFVALYSRDEKAYKWITGLLIAWYSVFTIASLWVTLKVMVFVFRNCVRTLCQPRVRNWWRKTTGITAMVFVVAVFSIVNWGIYESLGLFRKR
ncbi:hypothetical protein LUZ63_017645 [Rhynchospora breviuscula]|uniref:PGG domain-containing protein n=1 Tax=Rhynchospora breviuscula TaxID=2022672 RepID=A0A9Q0C2V9_9POAL|nr:hypothetical protein LUZ63_017645 [Rhynchospora breviuscula]